MNHLPEIHPYDTVSIEGHIQSCMNFYHPRALDVQGGCFHFFKDDGTVYDAHTRHLVSSARFVFTYANAYRHFEDAAYLEGCEHALRFIEQVHAKPDGGYAWLLHFGGQSATVLDDSNHCYGLAFVLLAYAHALKIKLEGAAHGLKNVFAVLEERFWQPEFGLYADEAPANWELSPYRGQNANMHMCEALLAAWDATGDELYLKRAYTLAKNIVQRQASLACPLAPIPNRIWEHYHADWSIDWGYNRHDPTNLFRPWGFQPGHSTEWAKLLLLLECHADMLQEQGLSTDWLLPQAQALFDEAVLRSWDSSHGGLCYGFAPHGEVCDSDKYHWVQAETLAAAAMLARRLGYPPGQGPYWVWYEKILSYVNRHFIDREHGAWYRILNRQNQRYNDEKSPAGKVDYHNMGALYSVLDCLKIKA